MGVGTIGPTARLDVRGDIRLGSAGQFLAVGGEENLRVIRGKIDADGSIIRGSGFTARRVSSSFYEITFTRAFAAPPVVTATVEYSVDVDVAMNWGQETSSRAGIVIWNHDGSAADPQPFSFIAVGPR